MERRLRAAVRGAEMTMVLALVAGFVLVGACARSGGGPATPVPSSPGVRLDVIYVPSDMLVVTAMLEAASVGPDDVVYDLGCGDGRIVITAARRYGARGVGVDIDPERVAEARANAARAGVTDRVTFFVQDLFVTDVSRATVVALYLSSDINLRLRPTLLRDLRPGSRVVSHRFDMGDWPPERTIQVPLPDGPRPVYLWRIPDRPAPRSHLSTRP
jgi:SAM-dependent methyltransferase